MSYLKTKI